MLLWKASWLFWLFDFYFYSRYVPHCHFSCMLIFIRAVLLLPLIMSLSTSSAGSLDSLCTVSKLLSSGLSVFLHKIPDHIMSCPEPSYSALFSLIVPSSAYLSFSSSIFISPSKMLLSATAGKIFQLNTKKERLPFYLTLTFSAQCGGSLARRDGSDWEGRGAASISVRMWVIPPANYSNHICLFQRWANVIHEKQQEAPW